VSTIRSQFRKLTPGQTVVTNYPLTYEAGGTGNRDIANLDQVLMFVKDQLIDGLLVPPISKQYNATQASAKEMMPWARANLIEPMQRIIKRAIEQEIYKPYLMNLGYSVKLIPRLTWEPPDHNKEEDGEYWSALVTAGICPPRYAAEQLGIPVEEFDKWQEEEEARRDKMFQQTQQQAQQEGAQPQPFSGNEGQESWQVTRLSA
jgi:hypothetical protein